MISSINAAATRDEVNQLKESWMKDPCFDIDQMDDDPKFGRYAMELRNFQEMMKERWRIEREEYLARKANDLGCPGNLKLASYIDAIEYRLSQLKDKVESI